MWPFEYNGQKAILITSDDFMQVDHRVSHRNVDQYWKKELSRLKSEGFVYVLIVTSFHFSSLVPALRHHVDRSDIKHAYFGQLNLGEPDDGS